MNSAPSIVRSKHLVAHYDWDEKNDIACTVRYHEISEYFVEWKTSVKFEQTLGKVSILQIKN
jgi:hypothetical protein